MSQKVLFFSTKSGFKLSKDIAHYYGSFLGKIKLLKFSDGEYIPHFEQSVRGCNVFLIGSTFPPVDNLMELLLMCDAAKRASAYSITLVIPYFGWARQDHKDQPRTPIAAKLIANLITASGASRVMTMDLHADQIQGFFDIPVDHLYASRIFINYIKKKLNIDKLTIASPDMGGAKRARSYAGYLGTDVVVCYKERKKANEIEFMNLIGNVKNRNIILIDDMVDTAGTLTEAAELIKKNGAKSVSAIATHPVLSGNSYEKITNSYIEELVVTDTIPIKQKYNKKIKVLSCAPLFAEVMHSIQKDESISSKFFI
ncbi:ribose-phosphate diphosphokinase [Blattabacterium cuenoti]